MSMTEWISKTVQLVLDKFPQFLEQLREMDPRLMWFVLIAIFVLLLVKELRK